MFSSPLLRFRIFEADIVEVRSFSPSLDLKKLKKLIQKKQPKREDGRFQLSLPVDRYFENFPSCPLATGLVYSDSSVWVEVQASVDQMDAVASNSVQKLLDKLDELAGKELSGTT